MKKPMQLKIRQTAHACTSFNHDIINTMRGRHSIRRRSLCCNGHGHTLYVCIQQLRGRQNVQAAAVAEDGREAEEEGRADEEAEKVRAGGDDGNSVGGVRPSRMASILHTQNAHMNNV